MNQETTSRIGFALGASFGLHLLFMVCAEALSSSDRPKTSNSPPVEISRVVVDGTTRPTGAGDSSFNSLPSIASSGFGTKYNLDAGVPTRIPIPPKDTRPATPAQPQVGPIVSNERPAPAINPQTAPPRNPTPANQEFYPPVTSGNETGTSPPSTPSRASQAGNQGQTRSRGPNRVAFPEYTVEPQVPASMVSGAVTSSVDVSVEVAADGSHTERIVRSSGSTAVDELVLSALKQWRWDPAAREGQAIASTQNFKFNFKPR